MSIKNYLLQWNTKFPFDRKYRKKYNIGFMSPEHKALNQIDIYLDIAEDHIVDNFVIQHSKKTKAIEKYNKTGQFIDDSISESIENDLFDKLDVSKLNSKQEVENEQL